MIKTRCIDLFCGVGGLTCGLRQGGIQVRAGIDLDPSCSYAYEVNNRAKFILGDVKSYPSEKLMRYWKGGDVKILVGCAPCQPFSRMKKNKENTSDSKWGLLYSFLGKVKEMNPDIVSMENVPEIKNARVFEDFLSGLIGQGYHVSYSIVDAADYGVPERRSRLILLASKYGDINLSKDALSNYRTTVREAIGNLPELAAGETSDIDPLHSCRRLSQINLRRIRNSIPGGTWNDWPAELLPECYRKKTGSTYSAVYGRMKWDDVAPTLTTQFDVYGTGRYGHPCQDRALSLREGALLQSFPPSYVFIDPHVPFSRKDIARQIGNAVPPALGYAIALSIKEHLAHHKADIVATRC